MRIVCDKNMPFAEAAFSTLGDVRIRDGRDIGPGDVRDADILAVRSTTQVNAGLLDGSRVRFVGTATIGTDHLDDAYLTARGITWCHAPGCNANSVSEYVTAALLCLGQRHGFEIEGKTLGVIGVGNVGRRVVEKARVLGLRVLPNDPPRARAGDTHEAGIPLVSLEQVLGEADILTWHVPLTKTGVDATWHMAGKACFDQVRPGMIVLNAARGAVVETQALVAALNAGTVAHAVIDTWEGEPGVQPDLLRRADIGTPHIAGHSFEGKVMGTVMVYEAACRFLGVAPVWSVEPLLPEPVVPEVRVDAAGRSDESVLHEVVRQVYAIETDDRALRRAAAASDPAAGFDRLRKAYPVRREFRYTRVGVANACDALRRKIDGLGFKRLRDF